MPMPIPAAQRARRGTPVLPNLDSVYGYDRRMVQSANRSLEQAEALLAGAESQGAVEFSDEQQELFESLLDDVQGAHEYFERQNSIAPPNINPATVGAKVISGSRGGEIFAGVGSTRDPELEIYSLDQPVASLDEFSIAGGRRYEPGEINFFSYLAGIITGDWKGRGEEHALAESTGTAGGYLVPTPMLGQLLDLARNRSVAFNAGAMTIPMTASTLRVPRLSKAATAEWRGENELITESQAEFGDLTFTAKTLASYSVLSRELFDDGVNVARSLENDFAEVIARGLDLAVLEGTGLADQPLGIANHPGVPKADREGVVVAYRDFINSVTAIRQKNGEPNSAILSPGLEGTLDSMRDADSNPLRPPRAFSELKRHMTNQIPEDLGAGNNETRLIVGDFKRCWVGLRSRLELQINPFDGERFQRFQVSLRGVLRADVQLTHPEHFHVTNGLLPLDPGA